MYFKILSVNFAYYYYYFQRVIERLAVESVLVPDKFCIKAHCYMTPSKVQANYLTLSYQKLEVINT